MAQVTDKILLTPEDIERVYGIPKSTQAKARMRGDFASYIKRGRSVFVLKADLDAWLSSLRRASTGHAAPRDLLAGNGRQP
jgi:hypothetical protein